VIIKDVSVARFSGPQAKSVHAILSDWDFKDPTNGRTVQV